MKKPLFSFYHLKNRLIVVYTSAFLCVMMLVMSIIYYFVRTAILESVDQSLHAQIGAISTTIETTADASIKNYFRARAWACVDAIYSSYERFKRGEITEEEAKRIAIEYVRAQKIGESGYAAITSKEAKVVYHPYEKAGTDLSSYPFVLDIIKKEEDFRQYQWKNATDSDYKEKSMYTVHFKGWDWYLSITGYNDEFNQLVTIEDFENNILAIPFGNTGYPVVIGFDGTLLIHPKYKGVNMISRKDSMGEVTRKAVAEKNGKTYYYWKNPDETRYRKKITLYKEVKGFDMIVAATAYEEEFMAPLVKLRYIFLWTTALCIAVICFLTIQISHGITRPLVEVKNWMKQAEDGDLEARARIESQDEIGEIGWSFNQLMDNLQRIQEKLIQEERHASMGELLAKIAHHLNTPLGSSITALSYLEKEARDIQEHLDHKTLKTNQLKHYLEANFESLEIMKQSLLSASSKIESFKGILLQSSQMVKKEVMVEEIMTVHYLQVWHRKLPNGVNISVEVGNLLPIETYPELFLLILHHLTENTLQHGLKESESTQIHVAIEPWASGMRVKYSDTGRGIAKANAERIFEPFYCPENHFAATGLGLYAVYYTVTQIFGGHISYEGDEGLGVHYTIDLPSLNAYSNEPL